MEYQIEEISEKDVPEQTRDRKSKYQSIIDGLAELSSGKALKVSGINETTIRNLVYQKFPKEFSIRKSGDSFYLYRK